MEQETDTHRRVDGEKDKNRGRFLQNIEVSTVYRGVTKMACEILEDNWCSIQQKIIVPLWKAIYKSKYELTKLDYDDFESMAGYELTKAMANFDESKSNIFTFAANVIKRKANTELRDCSDRDKRAALYCSESLDVPISEDQPTTKLDVVAAPQVEDNTDPYKIKRYLMQLSSAEKDVIIFKLIGFDDEDIVNTMGISKKKYSDAIKSMRIYEKASILRSRRR